MRLTTVQASYWVCHSLLLARSHQVHNILFASATYVPQFLTILFIAAVVNVAGTFGAVTSASRHWFKRSPHRGTDDYKRRLSLLQQAAATIIALKKNQSTVTEFSVASTRADSCSPAPSSCLRNSPPEVYYTQTPPVSPNLTPSLADPSVEDASAVTPLTPPTESVTRMCSLKDLSAVTRRRADPVMMTSQFMQAFPESLPEMTWAVVAMQLCLSVRLACEIGLVRAAFVAPYVTIGIRNLFELIRWKVVYTGHPDDASTSTLVRTFSVAVLVYFVLLVLPPLSALADLLEVGGVWINAVFLYGPMILILAANLGTFFGCVLNPDLSGAKKFFSHASSGRYFRTALPSRGAGKTKLHNYAMLFLRL